jgi:ABC-type Fe3+/spermidine/putrescine transport system ATPase subunit
MSDRIVLMNDGRIVQEGDPAEIYERPRSVFASHFIGEANLLRGTVTAAESDATRVRVGNIEIVAPAHAAEAGQEVVVSVRPERIAIGAAGAVLSAQNLFDGRIGRRIFLGNLVRFLVELAPGVVATVQASVEAAGLTEGDDVVVGWERDSSIVLTEQ